MRLIGSLTIIAGVLLAASCGERQSASTVPEPAERYVSHDLRTGAALVNIYAATAAGALNGPAANARPLVYVPNLRSDSVTVIDPATHAVVRTLPADRGPQHVVPSFDLSTLWVASSDGNSLTALDPVTGAKGPRLPVDDPYNVYFTPDGRLAVVMAERRHELDFRDAATMKLMGSTRVACRGLNHMDFTADDKYAIATCEFSGQLVKIDLARRRPMGYVRLQGAAMPQDIRSSPDGGVFYVADMMADGVRVVDPAVFKEIRLIKTGTGAHGIIVGRGGQPFYITNRGWHTVPGGRHGPGSITVLDPATQSILETWRIPGGGSPDMGNISADGKELWVSGRYDDEVYDFETATGKMIARVEVGLEPHGLCVWPQPGRFSLGHTGNMR